jgi:two-component system, chemotaxis family, protein-glutamate methylesterase/glutaminase
MANRDIIAIGTSAGGVEALIAVAKGLPSDLAASVVLTIHLPSHAKSSLDDLLNSVGALPAAFAEDGEKLRKSRIYIAPPNRHLLVEPDRISLGEGPRENNARPAIDAMLRSAAVCCGSRVVGAVLTGTLGDGASGLWAIHQAGGVTVVQDPKDAAFAEMPLTAVNRAKPDHIVSLADLPALLTSLTHQPAGETKPLPPGAKFEVEIARNGHSGMDKMDAFGRRSALACPDCGGVMWELDDGGMSRYRCHVGHTYTAEVMSLALDENLRRALASAMRALDERTALARKLHREAKASGHRFLAENWAQRIKEFEREADIIRDSTRRLDRLAAHADRAKQSAAE